MRLRHQRTVLNLLRVQFERQVARPFPSVHEYAALFRSRCQSSPLDGHELAGRVTYTIVDGTVRYHLLPDPSPPYRRVAPVPPSVSFRQV